MTFILPPRMNQEDHFYISGPMSGYAEYNWPYFTAVVKQLRAQGLTVTSPHEVPINHPAPWAECLRADIRAMLDCDSIIMLAGWPSSRGARLELDIALDLEMKAYYLDPYREAIIDMNRRP